MVPQNDIGETIKSVVKLTGQQKIIQLTMKTGLTMCFTLLKQSWENRNCNGYKYIFDYYCFIDIMLIKLNIFL